MLETSLMFTGITQGLYPVVEILRKPSLLSYRVDLGSQLSDGLKTGASVSVDGVCQTVTAIDRSVVTFEAIAETLRLTTLGELAEGDSVSIERSLAYGSEVGGHVVAGHVWGTGEVDSVEASSEGAHTLWIRVAGEWSRYLLPKGFVAVDGSSLTIGRVEPGTRFSLHLIPETLRLTKLGAKVAGDRVNIELDAQTVAIVDVAERVAREVAQSTAREVLESTARQAAESGATGEPSK